MRQTISGLLTAFAVVTATAAPALACGGGGGGGMFSAACSPCSQAYVSPCAQGYDAGYHHAGYQDVAAYERLPSPQYFYADQGPSFTGPGLLAPIPTYQESAVSGWGAYRHNYHYGYDGGRYANATSHYYDGAPAAEGPAIYSYRTYPRYDSGHGYLPRQSEFSRRFRYGYTPRGLHYGAYRFAGPRHYGRPVPVVRRYD